MHKWLLVAVLLCIVPQCLGQNCTNSSDPTVGECQYCAYDNQTKSLSHGIVAPFTQCLLQNDGFQCEKCHVSTYATQGCFDGNEGDLCVNQEDCSDGLFCTNYTDFKSMNPYCNVIDKQKTGVCATAVICTSNDDSSVKSCEYCAEYTHSDTYGIVLPFEECLLNNNPFIAQACDISAYEQQCCLGEGKTNAVCTRDYDCSDDYKCVNMTETPSPNWGGTLPLQLHGICLPKEYCLSQDDCVGCDYCAYYNETMGLCEYFEHCLKRNNPVYPECRPCETTRYSEEQCFAKDTYENAQVNLCVKTDDCSLGYYCKAVATQPSIHCGDVVPDQTYGSCELDIGYEVLFYSCILILWFIAIAGSFVGLSFTFSSLCACARNGYIIRRIQRSLLPLYRRVILYSSIVAFIMVVLVNFSFELYTPYEFQGRAMPFVVLVSVSFTWTIFTVFIIQPTLSERIFRKLAWITAPMLVLLILVFLLGMKLVYLYVLVSGVKFTAGMYFISRLTVKSETGRVRRSVRSFVVLSILITLGTCAILVLYCFGVLFGIFSIEVHYYYGETMNIIMSLVIGAWLPLVWKVAKKDTSYWRGLAVAGDSFFDNSSSFRSLSMSDSFGGGGGGGGGGDPLAHPLRRGFGNIEDSAMDSLHETMDEQRMRNVVDYADLHITKTLIGDGTTAQVFIGMYTNSKGRDVPVAVKLLRMYGMNADITPEIVASYRSESRIASMLRHPNIVQFYGICVEPPNLSLVYELCKHGSLKNHLETIANTRNLHFKVSLMMQLASAIEYIHGQIPMVIHRDIKPDNILLNEAWQIRLTDFGASRIIEGNRPLSITGSLTWQAPEILRMLTHGRQQNDIKMNEYDEKVDIYSTAIVFWQILYGKTPFLNIDQFQLVDAILDGKRPDLTSHDVTVPQELKDLLTKMWAADFTQRPSASQVVTALKVILATL